MRRVIRLLAMAAVVALAAGPLMAQTGAPGKTSALPKPAQGPAEEALAAWNEIGRKLIAMAEDFPEDKYDFKPNPQVRTFAEQLLHVAGANYFFTDPVQGKKPNQPEDLPRDKYKTKADVVAAVKKSFADGAAVIKEKGDAGMAQTVKHPFGNRMTHLSTLCMDLAMHASEHYGQLVVYYRVNGLVPPESRPRQR